MSAPNPLTVVAPPPRQLFPKLWPLKPDMVNQNTGRSRILVYFSQLSDAQAKVLHDVLPELLIVMAKVRQQQQLQARELMVRTFSKSESVLDQYQQEAWTHEHWHEAVLRELPCITLQETDQRCEGTPWNAEEDLLWVAHRGQRHFPLCQFTDAGQPDPRWTCLVAKAERDNRCREWELLAWLLTPNPFLTNDQTPMAALPDQPREVISLAGSTLKESRS